MALFGVVVTSTADVTDKIYAVIPPEDGMVVAGPRACACGTRYGTPRPLGLKAIKLDSVCYTDMAHLHTCRCSNFVHLEGGFGLMLYSFYQALVNNN